MMSKFWKNSIFFSQKCVKKYQKSIGSFTCIDTFSMQLQKMYISMCRYWHIWYRTDTVSNTNGLLKWWWIVDLGSSGLQIIFASFIQINDFDEFLEIKEPDPKINLELKVEFYLVELFWPDFNYMCIFQTKYCSIFTKIDILASLIWLKMKICPIGIVENHHFSFWVLWNVPFLNNLVSSFWWEYSNVVKIANKVWEFDFCKILTCNNKRLVLQPMQYMKSVETLYGFAIFFRWNDFWNLFL